MVLRLYFYERLLTNDDHNLTVLHEANQEQDVAMLIQNKALENH